MVTPYSTPPIPSAPHATPLTTNENIRPPRPPIHNPYDKFTQPDFDAWIGDITSALRKALGHESEPRGDGRAQSDATRSPGGDDESGDDEAVDDSFAEARARRGAKGKGRDPREGPGLGGRLHPIEIESSSEPSDQEADGVSEDGEEGYEWREGSEKDDAPGWFEGSDDGSDVVEIPNGRAGSGGSSPSVVIELLSDDDEEGDGREEDGPHGQPDQSSENIGDVEESFDEDRDGEPGQDRSEGGHDAIVDANEKYRLGMAKFGFPEPDGQREAHTPDIHTESRIMDPEVADFPPFHGITSSQPLELPDPWVGPETYAEDFYSGGDLRDDDVRSCSPSHLTPVRDGIGILHTPDTTPSKDTKNKRGEEEDALPSSSPFAPSPVELFEGIDVRGHMSDDWYGGLGFQDTRNDDTAQNGVPTAETNGQVDWNWPPAFSAGKFASASGRLATSQVRGSHIGDKLVDAVEDEVDDDELGELTYGAAPLGTSDLDVHKYQSEGREDGDGEVDDDSMDVVAKGRVDTPPQEHGQWQEEDVTVMQGESVIIYESFERGRMSPEVVDSPTDDITERVTSSIEPPANFGLRPTAFSTDEGVEMFERENIGKTGEETIGYTVIEVETEDEAGLVNEDDVASVSQGVLDEQSRENMAYIVEESVTEGRRTEERDVLEPTQRPSVVDISEARSDSHAQVVEGLLEVMPPLGEAEGHTESVPAASTTEDFVEAPLTERGPLEGVDPVLDTPLNHGGVEANLEENTDNPDNAPLPSSNKTDTAVDVANVNMRDDEETPNADSAGTVDVSAKDGPHVENVPTWVKTGIPMPVLADPSVPDRAAIPVSPTPGTPTLIQTPVNTAEELAAFDPLPSSSLNVEQLQPSQSSNGLFTPANGTYSGFGTPSRGESEIGDILPQEIAQIEELPQMDTMDESPVWDPRPEIRDILPREIAQIEELPQTDTTDENLVLDTRPETGDIHPQEIAQIEELPQMDTTDESPVLDSGPESAEIATKLEPASTDHPAALTSEPVEPPEHAEFAVPSHHAAGSVELTSVYLTMLQPSDHILHADPYPYSLSTPGSKLHDSLRQAVLGQDPDITSEEHSSSSSSSSSPSSSSPSSSSPSSDSGDKDAGPDNVVPNNIAPNNEITEAEDLVLMYPSEHEYNTESPLSVRQRTLPLEEEESISGHEVSGTIDADGKIDDRVASCEPHANGQHQLDTSLTVDDGDAFKLMDNGKLSPPAVEGDASASKDAIPTNDARESEGSPLEGKPVESLNSMTMPETKASGRPIIQVATEFAAQQTDGQCEPGDNDDIPSVMSESSSARPSKRKRKPHTPITRSKSAALLSAQRKGKEKRVEKGVENDEEYEGDDAVSENGSTSSGASMALKMLRTTSRASSPFAAAPSSSSSSGAPALNPSRQSKPEIPPAPLFHTHGSISHARQPTHLHQAPLTHATQQESQKTITRVKDVSKEPGPSQPASPQTRPSSSPLVTRSQCRFHKISLRTPGRKRMHFVVPGCSLGDRELMTKEGIKDHGSATIEDSKRMVANLQSQNINLDIVGNLRKLVGVDLLREQEVFYLPPRVRKPPAVSGPHLSAPDQVWMSPKNNIGSSPLSTLSPMSSISRASSESSPPRPRPQHPVTSLRYLQKPERLRLSTGNNIVTRSSPVPVSPLSPLSSAPYYSDSGLSDGEGVPGLKRQRKASSDVAGDVQDEEMGPSTGPAADSPTNARKAKRRNKRPGMDAAQYQPPLDDGAESEADSMAGKSPNKRAIKRARTSEAAGNTEGTETRKEKKRKLRLALTMDAEHEQGV